MLNSILTVLICVSLPTVGLTDEHKIESAVLQIVEMVDIPAQVAGPILSMEVQQGDIVSSHEQLAQIDDSESRIRMQEAQIQLEVITEQSESDVDIEFATKSRNVAVADLKRAQESNRKYSGVVSDREMDRLKLLVEKGDAEIKKLKFDKNLLRLQRELKLAGVKRSELDVQRHQIQTAISGQVVKIHRRMGEWVNIADPVFTIVRLDRLQVEEFLPVDIAQTNLAGSRASFLIGGRSLEGIVQFVSPEINPLNATVLVRFEFANPELDFRPGMKGTVVIFPSSNHDHSLGHK